MKIIGNGRARRLVLAAALGVGLGAVSHASAQNVSYLIDLNSRTATSLGHVRAAALNDVGQVVGGFVAADGRSHAFFTGPNGVGRTDLGKGFYPITYAYDINDAGQVVLRLFEPSPRDPYNRAWITGPNGVGITGLDALGGPFTRNTHAAGINASGQVAGWSETAFR